MGKSQGQAPYLAFASCVLLTRLSVLSLDLILYVQYRVCFPKVAQSTVSWRHRTNRLYLCLTCHSPYTRAGVSWYHIASCNMQVTYRVLDFRGVSSIVLWCIDLVGVLVVQVLTGFWARKPWSFFLSRPVASCYHFHALHRLWNDSQLLPTGSMKIRSRLVISPF